MKHLILLGVIGLSVAVFGLGWWAGIERARKYTYAYEANFYGSKVQEHLKNGQSLESGLGAFLSARYLYFANRAHASEVEDIEQYHQILPASVGDFKSGFGNDPCSYEEELRKFRQGQTK